MTERPEEPAVRSYEFFCLACLLVMWLALLQHDWGMVSLVPVLTGLGGVAGRWRLAPPLLLGALILLLTGTFAALARALGGRSGPLFDEPDILTDLLLAAAVLGYLAGQLRLRGLADGLFPLDPRAPKNQTPAAPMERRDTGREMADLVLFLMVSAVVALFGWELLPTRGPNLGFSLGAWRLMVLVWLLALGGILSVGLVTYSNRRYRTVAEASLFLQDVLWRETRGEQRRLYRWAAWRRLRAQRRKERS